VKKKPSSRGRKTKKISKIPDWFAAWKKRNRPAPLTKRWSIEEPEAILDYLHRDMPADEAAAACYYEYARESETLRKARREYGRTLQAERRPRRRKRRLTVTDAEQASH